MAVVRASDIRSLPAYIVFERHHHETPCARQWQGEKWWDGISDPPSKGRWVSKTYGDPIAQLCAATIAVDLVSFLSVPLVVQGSDCLKCAMNRTSSQFNLVIDDHVKRHCLLSPSLNFVC